MDSLSVNFLDLAILAILLVSGLLAFFRGFVREVLAIAGWIGAALITLRLFPYAQPFTHQYIPQPLLADAAAAGGIFIASLSLLWLVASAISRRVQESTIGPLDRSLGFLFGIARGAVLVSLAYLILIQFVPAKEHPDWLRNARALPVVRYGADLLLQLVPPEMREGLSKGAQGTTLPTLDNGQQKPDTDDKSGYTSGQRKLLDRIIRSTTDN
jgi:membrane protein required for colicin V production